MIIPVNSKITLKTGIRKRAIPLFGVMLIIAAIGMSSCKKRTPESHRPEAIELYTGSAKLLRLYADSFLRAPDSTSLLELNERFNHKLTALNFKYPSETCLEISEGENDTLTNLTERLVMLRDSILYSFAHPVIVGNDSIPEDSIKK